MILEYFYVEVANLGAGRMGAQLFGPIGGKRPFGSYLKSWGFGPGWSKVPVALPVLIPVPVLFSASAGSAAKFHTEKSLVLA